MFSQVALLLVASVCLCNANPLTSSSRTLIPRDDVKNCQNVTLGLNASCWDLIPPKVGMTTWLKNWNSNTTTCKPGEAWANCFVREANLTTNLTTNLTAPIRCDLIGSEVCPQPTLDVAADVSAEVVYGVAAIWALQQYMTTLYQFIEVEPGVSYAKNEFLAQGAPRSAKPIIVDLLNYFGDTIALDLAKLITTPGAIGQPTFVIPTEFVAPQVVGQTVGYLLQHIMKDWRSGNFTALGTDGNLIAILADS